MIHVYLLSRKSINIKCYNWIMQKSFYRELPFLFKISTLFFMLWLGLIAPKIIGDDKKQKNLTLIERVNLAMKSLK